MLYSYSCSAHNKFRANCSQERNTVKNPSADLPFASASSSPHPLTVERIQQTLLNGVVLSALLNDEVLVSFSPGELPRLAFNKKPDPGMSVALDAAILGGFAQFHHGTCAAIDTLINRPREFLLADGDYARELVATLSDNASEEQRRTAYANIGFGIILGDVVRPLSEGAYHGLTNDGRHVLIPAETILSGIDAGILNQLTEELSGAAMGRGNKRSIQRRALRTIEYLRHPKEPDQLRRKGRVQ